MTDLFTGTNLSIENYDSTLIGWNTQVVQPNVNLSAPTTNFCLSAPARNNLITTHTWTITDNGQSCPRQITGSIFYDLKGNNIDDGILDTPARTISLRLWRDNDNSNTINAGDTLVRGAVTDNFSS